MPGKQLIDQICGCDKPQPEHETGQSAGGSICASHEIYDQSHRNSLHERGNDGEEINYRVGITWLTGSANPRPPSRKEQFRVIPDESADHRDDDTDDHSEPVDQTKVHGSLLCDMDRRTESFCCYNPNICSTVHVQDSFSNLVLALVKSSYGGDVLDPTRGRGTARNRSYCIDGLCSCVWITIISSR